MPAALTIAGVDPCGGAGIAADLKTFAALGIHGTCVITSLTAQNTRGIIGHQDVPVEFIEEQFKAVVSDIEINSVKTGMLSSPEIVGTVARLLRDTKLPFVIDPVMAAEAGGELLKDDAVNVLIEELMPVCSVITPNVAEAERLSGLKIKDIEDAEKAAKKIYEMGADAVIVTGGHLDYIDVFFDGKVTYISGTKVNGGTHGSGCTHSAAIAAQLAKGTPLLEAARIAKKFVESAIIAGMAFGTGNAPVNQIGPLIADAQRHQVRQKMEEAVEIIEKNMAPELIPEVGCNIAMAVSDASSVRDVAAVEGRIVRHKGAPRAVGCTAFGASSHIARIVLTAMRFDSSIKAAMNIRYSQETLSACKSIGLNIASFSREDEPEDSATMEWGVGEAIKRAGRVPDVIFDTGGIGKEAMIRLLGKDAVDVAGKVLQISDAMMK